MANIGRTQMLFNEDYEYKLSCEQNRINERIRREKLSREERNEEDLEEKILKIVQKREQKERDDAFKRMHPNW